jgi:hypothetical protein
VTPNEQSGRRIEYSIAGLTVAGFVISSVHWGWRLGAAFVLGAAISWINYRWLRGAVTTLTQPVTIQQGQPTPKISKRPFVKLLAGFALLLGSLYVILSSPIIPGEGFLAGLFVVVAAVLVEMIYMVTRGSQPAQGA